jgi:hypothetical protein
MDTSHRRVTEETEWYRYYESPEHPYIYESKFATGEASVSLAGLRSRWQSWTDGQRVQFAQAFKWKPALDAEDERVLGFLMRQKGEMISSSIAHLVAKARDKRGAAAFLVSCLRAYPHNRGNFLTALADLAAPETAPDLYLVFRECRDNVERDAADYGSVANLLYCSAALFKVTADRKYLDIIFSYLHHGEAQVRSDAENSMRWAGVSG